MALGALGATSGSCTVGIGPRGAGGAGLGTWQAGVVALCALLTPALVPKLSRSAVGAQSDGRGPNQGAACAVDAHVAVVRSVPRVAPRAAAKTLAQ